MPVLGSVEALELRAQDPRCLRQADAGAPAGRWPSDAGEVAVTDGWRRPSRPGSAAPSPSTDARTVVGLVENPGDLDDELALVARAHADPPTGGNGPGAASPERAAALPATLGGGSRRARLPRRACATATQSERATAAAGALALATVVLLLVALIAAAGFVAVAQRRLRQLGMLAAVGATNKHLRLVLLATGPRSGPAPPSPAPPPAWWPGSPSLDGWRRSPATGSIG